MTSFAPGTPKKVMKKVEKQLNKAQEKGEKQFNKAQEKGLGFPGGQQRAIPAKPGATPKPGATFISPRPAPLKKVMNKMLEGKTKSSIGRQNIPGSPFSGGSGTAGLGTASPGKMPLPSKPMPGMGGASGPIGTAGTPPASLGLMGAAPGKKLMMKKGGSVSSASKRADGIATKGKTKGKMI